MDPEFLLPQVTAVDPAETLHRTLLVSPGRTDFTTIQDAVNAAQPGDTVLVHGGVYRERISFPRAGEAGRPITVCGVRNQIVIVTPSFPLDGSSRTVADHPNVFRRVDFNRDRFVELDAVGIWEAPAHLRLTRVFSLDECERRLASWFYDTADDALYLRSSGAALASDLAYIVEDSARPAFDVPQSDIVIDGLQIAFGQHGVLIASDTCRVAVRNCRVYCNGIAGIQLSGTHHIVARNEVFRNNHAGIHIVQSGSYCRIANNCAWHNGPNNGDRTGTGPSNDTGILARGGYNVFEHNVIDGLHQYAFRNKYQANDTVAFRHNVVRGFYYCQSPNVRNNTIIVDSAGMRFGMYIDRVRPSVTDRIETVDPGGRHRRTNIIFPAAEKEEPRFADLAYRDFRPQGNCPHLGSGAFPGDVAVVFVDPVNGNDDNDGRSTITAFASLSKAMQTVYAGDTVYLLPGVYNEPLVFSVGGLSVDEPLRVRAHGMSSGVVLAGGVSLLPAVDWTDTAFAPLAYISLEGLTFRDAPVTIADCRDVRLSYCVLAEHDTAASFSNCNGVRLDHVTIRKAATGVSFAGCSDISVTNSLFTDTPTRIACDEASQAELYTAYIADTTVALDADQALPMGSSLGFAAADFTFAGARPASASDRLDIVELRAVGLAPTVASLLWETPRGVTRSRVELVQPDTGAARIIELVDTFQVMGEMFDMTFRLSAFYTTGRNVTLSDLQPDTAYEVRVTAFEAEGAACHTTTLRFTTPAVVADAATYYVAADGDDIADGTTRETAWRSFARAARSAGPGDRVLVLPGTYMESLRPRTSGTEARPIVYESAEPQGAVIDMMQSLAAGIELANVDHVHVKGFAFANSSTMANHYVVVTSGAGIRISGCHVRYPTGLGWDKLGAATGGLVASHAPDLMIDNNVFLCGYVGVGLGSCPGAKVLNNTIVGEGNYGVTIVPDSKEETYTVRNNLFCRAILGYKVNACLSTYNLVPQLDADYNLYAIPDDHNGSIGMLSDLKHIHDMDAWRDASECDRNSITAMPNFVAPERGDFRLQPDSPGNTAADDGGVVGMRQ